MATRQESVDTGSCYSALTVVLGFFLNTILGCPEVCRVDWATGCEFRKYLLVPWFGTKGKNRKMFLHAEFMDSVPHGLWQVVHEQEDSIGVISETVLAEMKFLHGKLVGDIFMYGPIQYTDPGKSSPTQKHFHLLGMASTEGYATGHWSYSLPYRGFASYFKKGYRGAYFTAITGDGTRLMEARYNGKGNELAMTRYNDLGSEVMRSGEDEITHVTAPASSSASRKRKEQEGEAMSSKRQRTNALL